MLRLRGIHLVSVEQHHLVEFLFAQMELQKCSIAELARLSDIPYETIRNWKYQRKSPIIHTLDKALRALGWQLTAEVVSRYSPDWKARNESTYSMER